MSDFGSKIMSKYGWKEGDGLGKNRNGIAIPIKSSMKFNSAGLGFNHSTKLVTGWWHDVYNSAAKDLDAEDDPDVGKKTKKKKQNNKLSVSFKGKGYDSFQKGCVLHGSTEEDIDKPIIEPVSDSQAGNVVSISNLATTTWGNLDDDALLAACGGRTAHKAARFGLNLSGKLARVEAQEARISSQHATRLKQFNEEASGKICKKSTAENENEEVVRKKKKSKKDVDHDSDNSEDCETSKTKKKNKKRNGDVESDEIQTVKSVKKSKHVEAEDEVEKDVPRKKKKKSKKSTEDDIIDLTETDEKPKKSKKKRTKKCE